MIIFNDSVSKFTSAAFEFFAEACFLVSASAKKPRIKFLVVLKNISPFEMFRTFQIFSNLIS